MQSRVDDEDALNSGPLAPIGFQGRRATLHHLFACVPRAGRDVDVRSRGIKSAARQIGSTSMALTRLPATAGVRSMHPLGGLSTVLGGDALRDPADSHL